jgi:hypothetical protein
MRAFALTVIAAMVALCAGAAEARVWSDAQGRFNVEVPRGWTDDEQNRRSDAELSFAAFFTPSRDCYVVGFPNPNTVSNTPFEVYRYALDAAHFSAEHWVALANGIPSVFPANSAVFVSQSVDRTNFWPIQRVVMRNGQGLVQGGLQLRPGVDLVVFCTSVSGAEGPEGFDAMIRGVTTTRDAELQVTATQQEADYNARQAAAAAATAQAAQKQAEPPASRRRNRDDN